MRQSDAGVTLIEVMVVLVLVGIMAGTVGLSLGSVDRGMTAATEATLLTARLNRATDEIVLTGLPMAFIWDETGYRFEVWADGNWIPHPVNMLATPHLLGGAQFAEGEGRSTGRFAVDGTLLPASGVVLRIALRDGTGSDAVVTFDGAGAWQEDAL